VVHGTFSAKEERKRQQAAVERALRLTFRVILPELARAEFPTGYAEPSYNKKYIRDYWTLFAVSRELDVPIGELIAAQRTDVGRRIERGHMREAAGEIATRVKRFPVPVREVLMLRTAGMSWVRICTALPGRVEWSVRDDWRSACRELFRDCYTAVMQLQ